jgi:hypothetical protein
MGRLRRPKVFPLNASGRWRGRPGRAEYFATRCLIDNDAFVQWRQGFVMLHDGALTVRIGSYTDIDEARAFADGPAEERA